MKSDKNNQIYLGRVGVESHCAEKKAYNVLTRLSLILSYDIVYYLQTHCKDGG